MSKAGIVVSTLQRALLLLHLLIRFFLRPSTKTWHYSSTLRGLITKGLKGAGKTSVVLWT